MPYNIENIFICIAAPFLLAALGTNTGNRKNYIFTVLGFVCCIISAYLNTFFSVLYGAQETSAVLEISPVIEETVKLIPLLFGLIVFELQPHEGDNIIFNIAVGFATFENICYLIQNGAGHFSFIFFRGIGTGAMHVICGAIVGGGLAYVWQRTWLKIAGTCGLLGAAITFHALYNLLIAYGGAVQYAAYVLPVVILAAGKLIARRLTL